MTSKLSVHKNTVEKRRRSHVSRELIQGLKKTLSETDVRAYAVVCITAEGDRCCYWDTGSIMPMYAFAETIFSMLKDDLRDSDIEDTWKPTLRIDG